MNKNQENSEVSANDAADSILIDSEDGNAMRKERQRMKVISTNPEFVIELDELDFPDAHFGFMYDVYRKGELWKRVTREELDELRKKYGF